MMVGSRAGSLPHSRIGQSRVSGIEPVAAYTAAMSASTPAVLSRRAAIAACAVLFLIACAAAFYVIVPAARRPGRLRRRGQRRLLRPARPGPPLESPSRCDAQAAVDHCLRARLQRLPRLAADLVAGHLPLRVERRPGGNPRRPVRGPGGCDIRRGGGHRFAGPASRMWPSATRSSGRSWVACWLAWR